jgi:rod shape determining protein RodA
MLLISKQIHNKKTKWLDFGNIFMLDKYLLISLATLLCISFVALYSAGSGNYEIWLKKQLISFLIGLLFLAIGSSINEMLVYRFSYYFYIICIILLLFASIGGYKANGAVRWIDLKFIKIQPSEFMKLAIILALSRFLHDSYNLNRHPLTTTAISFILIAIPCAIVVMQPDLATTIVLLGIGVAMIFCGGLSYRYIILALISFALTIPLIWSKLYSYQKLRIVNFMNPEYDYLNSGYNIIQSKIGLGSGGFIGKGIAKGSQSQLRFLPEKQTDFIYSMIGEEMGFIGCFLILISFFYIINYCYKNAVASKLWFSKCTLLGIGVFFFNHCIVNIGMTLGIVPAAGVPLPMVSYGGSVLITSMFMIGLISNISTNIRYNLKLF